MGNTDMITKIKSTPCMYHLCKNKTIFTKILCDLCWGQLPYSLQTEIVDTWNNLDELTVKLIKISEYLDEVNKVY